MYQTVKNQQLTVLGAPREYIQGPGALNELPQLAARFGAGNVFAIIPPELKDRICAPLDKAFAAVDGKVTWADFGGECTLAEGDRLAAQVGNANVIAAIGGGKCIDTGKYIARQLDLPMFSVPSIASNDAPTSRLYVLYDENHAGAGADAMRFNPDVVLVDTDIIAEAPPVFLRSGIGDALSKFFEARGVASTGGANFFTAQPPHVIGKLSEVCLDTVIETGPACLEALERGERHEDFEALVETLILLSGIVFESGGLSIAHAVSYGLTLVPETTNTLHGEQVAYGMLVQLQVEGDDDYLAKMTKFNRQIGLPANMVDFGVPQNRIADVIEVIANAVMVVDFAQNCPVPLSIERLSEAMHKLEIAG